MGAYGRTLKGERCKDGRNRQLTTEAEFYRSMALKAVGSKIIISRRRFIGMAPVVEHTLREIVERNLSDFFNSDQFQIQIT